MSDVGFVLDNCEVDYEMVSRSFSRGKIFSRYLILIIIIRLENCY